MKLVVIGGAFAGLELLLQVSGRRSAYESVTLIDKRGEHSYTPLIHEALTARLTPSQVTMQLGPWMERTFGGRFIQQAATQVVPGPQGKVVVASGEEVPFDVLVLATGSAHRLEDLRRDGAIAHVGAMKFTNDVPIMKRALGAEQGPRRVTVIGDGLTGVELAAELALHARQTQRRLEVKLVGREELPLGYMSVKLRQKANQALLDLGVQRSIERLAAPPESAGEPEGAEELLVWATGTAPQSLPAGLARTPGGFFAVDRHLRVKGQANIFAIGDNAQLQDDQGVVIPTAMRASEAIFQGTWLGKRLHALASGAKLAPYGAKPDFPFYGVSLGDKAIFSFKGMGFNSWAGVGFRRFLLFGYQVRLGWK